MQRNEFLKLVGGQSGNADYAPVACLLRNGYACAGYVNLSINEQYTDLCILLNARMVDLREPNRRTERGAVHDFGEFLEEFVIGMMKKTHLDKTVPDEESDESGSDPFQDRFGISIPLTAISYDEMAIVYPVTPIGDLLRRAKAETKSGDERVSSFFDFENKSLVLKVLRTKLW